MAGNLSLLSNVVKITMADSGPVISDVAFEEYGLTADNAAQAELIVSGQNFVAADDGNLIRFENPEAGFTIVSTAATSTQLSAVIPLGTPTGIYAVRILNSKGISQPGPAKITITDAASPMSSALRG